MTSFLDAILSGVVAMSAWEVIAVVLAIAYLLLAMKESQWCWLCAFVSTAIYTLLFWNVSLLMDSALSVFYLLMAVYGWWEWQRGGETHHGVEIHSWRMGTHCLVIGLVLLVTAVSGYLLAENTQAAWPYVDAFTTWSSVVTTYMVAKKVLENWIYWIVIDSVSALLYIDRGLYLTALLFVAYVVICVFGFFNWRRHEQAAVAVTA